ncbi:MAG TPA: type II toxin-antitoxin system prevent-host-death family antitoxin [Bryobacterales bacterium]|nr:type II toxin-antitoxin system prevent-host-death family antitoxin [Bryobacterales bacterium]
MIKTLRESKANLSELVEQASRGEDVLITVRGKVKARLTRATEASDESEKAAWLRDLRKLRQRYATAGGPVSSDEVLAEIREER